MDSESRVLLDQLARRIQELEARLANLEARTPPLQPHEQAGLSSFAAQTEAAIPPPLPAALDSSQAPIDDPYYQPEMLSLELSDPVVPSPTVPHNDEDTAEMPIPAIALPPPASVESQAGLVWMSRIGAVTLIMFVAYAFKYAIDNEWIGPAGRVMVGILSGALAVFAADRLWNRGHKVFAQAITALGICILYLSFWAAYSLYQLVPQPAALILMVATTAASGALALRYDARAVALLALAGGYVTPFLIASNEPNHLFFGCYLVVINVVATLLARRKGWRVVEIVAMVSTILLHAAWFLQGKVGERMGSSFALAQFAVFGLQPVAWQTIVKQVAAAIGIVALHERDEMSCVLFGGVLAAAGIAWSAMRKRDVLLLGSLASWVICFVGYQHNAGQESQLFLYASLGFAAFLAAILTVRFTPLGVAGFAALALNGVAYYAMSYVLLDKTNHGYMGLLAVGVAATYLFAAVRLRESAAPKAALLGAGLALAFLTLAIPIQLTGFSITIAWAIEAAALAFIATRLNSYWALGASWVVAWLAFMRLQLIDQEQYWPQFGEPYTLLANPRFTPFAIATLCFGLIAYFTSKVQGVQKFLPAIPLVLTHLTLLWGLHLEAFAYIGATHVSGSDATSLRALSSSVLLAAYGLLLIGLGIARSQPFHRLLGLGLLALVVVKLYVFDIWLLGRIYRILAFGAIGALLLSSSFLYSRYRTRIAALLKHE